MRNTLQEEAEFFCRRASSNLLSIFDHVFQESELLTKETYKEKQVNPIAGGNNRNSRQKVVVVLGSPRSGTSMTAGLLSILGVDMGNCRKSDPENPTGYFEDSDFLSLIDEVYEAARPGSNGFHPPRIESIMAQKGCFDERIGQLVQHRLSACRSTIWGWKAVGTSLTIDLFLPHLVNPHFVAALRHPLDTAHSVIRYSKSKFKTYEPLNLLQALAVCNLYYRHIFSFLEKHPGLPTTFVSFEETVRDPIHQARRLCHFLALSPADGQLEAAKNFVTAKGHMTRLKLKAKGNAYLSKMFSASIQFLGRALLIRQ